MICFLLTDFVQREKRCSSSVPRSWKEPFSSILPDHSRKFTTPFLGSIDSIHFLTEQTNSLGLRRVSRGHFRTRKKKKKKKKGKRKRKKSFALERFSSKDFNRFSILSELKGSKLKLDKTSRENEFRWIPVLIDGGKCFFIILRFNRWKIKN